MIDKDGYRKNVGIILCNLENKLLICKRLGEKSWQFPQGGFEENENAESAMFRELFEEVGLEKNDIMILGSTNEWLKYDLPKKYQRKTNNKLCIGQKQKWFLLRLISTLFAYFKALSIRLFKHLLIEFFLFFLIKLTFYLFFQLKY